MANIGSVDRMLRFVFGALLLVIPFLGVLPDSPNAAGMVRSACAAIAIVLLATAVRRFCPAYAVRGLRACPQGSK